MRYFPSLIIGGVIAGAFALVSDRAYAQDGKGGSREIELDGTTQPAAPPPTPSKQPKATQAQTSTASIVEADRLFEAHKWAEAAVLLHRISQSPGLPRERDLAQFHLAIALVHLKLHQAAYSIFASIADMPLHLKHRETLVWVERIATALPDAADVVETIGKYDEAAVSDLLSRPQDRDAAAHLFYLLGRYKYRNRQYEEAIRLLGKVPSTSAYYTKAQHIIGVTHVQLRQPVPAVRSFGRILHHIDDGPTSALDGDQSRMRDLAFLSSARTYYSAAVHVEPDGSTAVDDVKLGVAVKYWDRVDTGGELGLDALFEQSWAFTLLGDYTRALGNIHTLDAPFFPRSYYPEAELLKAGIYLATCHDADAETLVARFKQKYEPIRVELAKLVTRLDGEGSAFAADAAYAILKDVRDGRSTLPLPVKAVAEMALTDRELLRHVHYVQLIDDEQKRLARLSSSGALQNQASALVDELKDGLQLSRDLALHLTTQIARARTQERLTELQTHLETSTNILIEIAERRRGSSLHTLGIGVGMTRALRQGQTTTTATTTTTTKRVFKDTVEADDEHVLWPFTGEYWRDEVGLYRQTITSKCVAAAR
jgi:tetratricopeptide (TPR) repeat protein